MITDLRVGDYIEKSELDTYPKYKDVVEVFREYGFNDATNGFDFLMSPVCDGLVIKEGSLLASANNAKHTGRKLTYNDIMSLKKDKDIIKANVDAILNPVNDECFREDSTIKEISKLSKAVLAMESLGHEWDEEKGRWFRKEYF